MLHTFVLRINSCIFIYWDTRQSFRQQLHFDTRSHQIITVRAMLGKLISLMMMILITPLVLVNTRVERTRRSIIMDRGYHTNNCVGSLKLITNTDSHTFTMNMTMVLVRNIARVVVEGSCCGTIYSGLRYRGRSHRIESQGEFLTRIRKVKSVILNNCWLTDRFLPILISKQSMITIRI